MFGLKSHGWISFCLQKLRASKLIWGLAPSINNQTGLEMYLSGLPGVALLSQNLLGTLTSAIHLKKLNGCIYLIFFINGYNT
jgi:hypothetical protein